MPDKWISSASSEAELKSAITAFEQILEAEPNDRLALETLGDAYERMGDAAKALTYLSRLGLVVLHDEDAKVAGDLARRLKALDAGPETQALAGRLQELVAQSRSKRAEAGAAPAPRRPHDITREVSLAWDLLQAEEITQDEYATIVKDLSENTTKNLDVPVSVLHALHDRGHLHYESILAFLSRSSGKPLINIGHFDIQADVYNQLDSEFMARRGAIAFEKMGKDLLVAVLNPFDIELQEDVRKVTDRKCHFYLTGAVEYDKALSEIRKFQSLA